MVMMMMMMRRRRRRMKIKDDKSSNFHDVTMMKQLLLFEIASNVSKQRALDFPLLIFRSPSCTQVDRPVFFWVRGSPDSLYGQSLPSEALYYLIPVAHILQASHLIWSTAW